MPEEARTGESGADAVHNRHQRSFYFMAPSLDLYWKVVTKFGQFVANNSGKDAKGSADESTATDTADHDDYEFESLIQFPADASSLSIILFVLLFPFRWLLHMTVPDVRILDEQGLPMKYPTRRACLACVACLLWLMVGSYAMVSSLEMLADLLDIPTAVIGVTVSAAGTSLPNYVASKVAAERGFGVSFALIIDMFDALEQNSLFH